MFCTNGTTLKKICYFIIKLNCLIKLCVLHSCTFSLSSLYIAGVKILHDARIRYHYSKDPIENIVISLTGMSTSVIKIMIILYLI